jgi:hypothetical protein
VGVAATPNFFGLRLAQTLIVPDLQPPCHPLSFITSSSSSAKNFSLLHRFEQHQNWDEKNGWQSHLNNLRLILQPLISFNLIQQWLKVFPIPQLSTGLARLKALMNFYPNPFSYLGLAE